MTVVGPSGTADFLAFEEKFRRTSESIGDPSVGFDGIFIGTRM